MLKYSQFSVLHQRHWSLPVAENLKRKIYVLLLWNLWLMFCNKGSYKWRNLDIRERNYMQHEIDVEILDTKTKQGSSTASHILTNARISASICVFLTYVTLTRCEALGLLKLIGLCKHHLDHGSGGLATLFILLQSIRRHQKPTGSHVRSPVITNLAGQIYLRKKHL